MYNKDTMPKVYHYFNVGQLPQTTNSIDGQNPLLLSINKTEYVAKENNPTHSHKYLEFFYIIDGEGEFTTSDTHLPLKKHDILAVNAEVMHVQRSTAFDRPLVFYSLLFDNIRINTLKENCIGENDFIYQPFHNENNEFFAYISRLLAEISTKKSGYYLALKGIVLELFVALCRVVNDGNVTPVPRVNPSIKAAKEYIDSHFSETITLGELAKLAYTDKYYLAHQFKKQYNVSPMQYLTAVRMNRAAQLLSRENLSITEIASQVGYDNPIYFSEQFKKHIGTTPSIYRKITANTEAPH